VNAKQYIQGNVLSVEAGTTLSLVADGDVSQSLEVVVVEPGARLDLVVLHSSSCMVQHGITLKQNGVLNLFYFALGGDEVAQNLRVDLHGENVECNIFGFSAASQSQKFKTTFIIHHAEPNCHSTQLFKQVAAGNASVDFGGRVIVAKDAQRTDAQQTCRTLLLSETAHAYAQPQLEIYADDVKCSHGATVGQLDAEALFYLRSRGIGLAEAQQLLLLSFADEVVQKIPSVEVRERVGKLVAERLRGLTI